MATLKNLWTRISAWHRDNLPEELTETWRTREFLNAAASKAAMAEAEQAIGLKFPTDVKDSYSLHDGSRDEYSILPWGYYLLSISEIVASWRSWQSHVSSGMWEGWKSDPKGPIRPVHWNLRWLPISANGGGDHQCIDLDPAPRGTAGQVICFSHEVGPTQVLAVGFKEWLNKYAEDLEAGHYRYHPQEWWVIPVDEGN